MNDSLRLLALVIIGGLIAGSIVAKFSSNTVVNTALGNSSAGTTFNTQKIANIVWALSSSATTTSIVNSDASDRVIEQVQYYCSGIGTSKTAFTGTGLAALIFTAATTSASAPASISTTNAFLNTTIATSSTELFVASTTPGLTSTAINRVWASGSYITFSTNATNTASCTIGVTYMGL